MRITPRIGMGIITSMIPKITKRMRDLVLMLIVWAFLGLYSPWLEYPAALAAGCFIVIYNILKITLLRHYQ